MRSLWGSCMEKPRVNRRRFYQSHRLSGYIATVCRAVFMYDCKLTFNSVHPSSICPYTPTFSTPAERGHFGQDPDSWGPYPQPEEHRPDPATGQADRHHRPVRIRQIIPGLRHPVRRRPAAPCRIAIGLTAAVPVDDGETRRSEEHTADLQSLIRTSSAFFCLTK